jgi:AcrR family transcriptional regulator
MKQTTSQKRTGGRSARVREAVIQAALEELTTKGYEQFSINNVARCADVHETSIYRRWGTRDGLILDTLHAAHAHHPAPDSGSLYGDLCQLLMNSCNWLKSPLGRSLMQFAASVHPAHPSYAVMKELWRHRTPALEAIFTRAVERGEWQAGVPFRLRLDAMLGAVVWRVSVTQDEITESQIQELVSILCRDGLVDRRSEAG